METHDLWRTGPKTVLKRVDYHILTVFFNSYYYWIYSLKYAIRVRFLNQRLYEPILLSDTKFRATSMIPFSNERFLWTGSVSCINNAYESVGAVDELI